jgi:hypothetical protein
MAEKSKRWLERLIALILASVMVLVFFGRVEKISTAAERESVQQCLSSLRVGMQFFALSDIVRGRVADMRIYENTNPMQFQDQEKLPPNYAGEFDTEDAVTIGGGQWYFDKSARQLVYRVSHYPLYEGDNRQELRYRLEYSDVVGDVFSLRLSPVEGET